MHIRGREQTIIHGNYTKKLIPAAGGTWGPRSAHPDAFWDRSIGTIPTVSSNLIDIRYFTIEISSLNYLANEMHQALNEAIATAILCRQLCRFLRAFIWYRCPSIETARNLPELRSSPIYRFPELCGCSKARNEITDESSIITVKHFNKYLQ
jgi:hypothetical protein